MKIEIDLSNRRELEKTRAELQRYLGIIEFALQDKAAQNGNGHVEMFSIKDAPFGLRGEDSAVIEVLNKLPSKFTTTDVVLGFGDDAKEKRGAIKSALKRAEESGSIVVVNRGRGRRPTEFEKALQS